MQDVITYVSAANTLGAFRDFANARNMSAPTIIRACEINLRMRLFSGTDGVTPYPLENLQGIVSWQFIMDADFVESTNYILEAANDQITVSEVTDTINGIERSFTEVKIPLLNTNTEELVTWLNGAKSKTGLVAELIGFDASANQVFVIQLEGFTVRNRIVSLGQPTVISPDYLTAAQVQALIAGISVSGNNISINDAGGYFSGSTVEKALQEIGEQLNGVQTTLEGI